MAQGTNITNLGHEKRSLIAWLKGPCFVPEVLTLKAGYLRLGPGKIDLKSEKISLSVALINGMNCG